MIKILLAVAAFATIQATRPIIPIPTNFKIDEKVYQLDANKKLSTFLRTD